LRSYYLGERLIAHLEGGGEASTLRYIHQDQLTGTSVMSDADGNL
jgi:YD repeat-containing protein